MWRLVLVLVCLAVPVRAQSGAVFYFQAFGDWAVFCEQDMVSAQKSCFMNTPPPQVMRPFARLTVQAGPQGPLIEAKTYRPYPGGGPMGLSVDGNAVESAPSNRWGEAQWQGVQANRLIAQMTTGSGMRLQIGTTVSALSLSGFPDALQTLQTLRRAHGI